MTTVIDIAGLRKHYPRTWRGVRALDGLDLSVAEGEIHGLLGPNASGKTTALRVLLGLVRADAGQMRIFDREVPRHLPRVLGAVGAVLDRPRFFDDFTARRTLRLLATAGGVKRRRVAEVLAQVGLSGNAKERVGSYSRGMRQRLALAAALLKEPQLLILDDPCAGLDPAGVTDLRALLRVLADDGVTVLVASHVLADVQQLCDTVTIVSRGQRIAAGPVADLLASHDKGDVRVRIGDLTAAAKLVADAGLPVEVYDDHMVVSDLAAPVWITEALGRKRLWVSELTPLPPDLERVYRSLVGGLPTLPGQVDQIAELSGLLDTDQPPDGDAPPPEPELPPAPAPAATDTTPAPAITAPAPATAVTDAAPDETVAAPAIAATAPAIAALAVPEIPEQPSPMTTPAEAAVTEVIPLPEVPGAREAAEPQPSDTETAAEAGPVLVDAPPISAPPASLVPTDVTPTAPPEETAVVAVNGQQDAEPAPVDEAAEPVGAPSAQVATAPDREEVRP